MQSEVKYFFKSSALFSYFCKKELYTVKKYLYHPSHLPKMKNTDFYAVLAIYGISAYDLDLDFPIGHYVCQLCHILAAKVRHFGDNKKSQLRTQRNARPSAQRKLARMTERILFLHNQNSFFIPMTPKIVHMDRPCLKIGSGK